MNHAAIEKLAQAAGLMQEWVDASGMRQTVSIDSLHTILSALGLPCASDSQCRASHAWLAEQQATLPPLVTATSGQPVTLPGADDFSGIAYRIELENGGSISGRIADDYGKQLPAIERCGYHRLLLGKQSIILAVAPVRCFGIEDALQSRRQPGATAAPRLWALGVQLYSLRRAGDGGIGDFSALASLARDAAGHGAAALAISPVHAMFSADLSRYSPYAPSSRLFLNALHIDPASIAGPAALAAALAMTGPDTQQALLQVGQQDLIDWPVAARLRLRLLRALYTQFSQQPSAQARQEFDAFRHQGGDALQAHARFETLHAWRLAHGENGYWKTWPAAWEHPHSAQVKAFAQQHADEVRFHEFLQWQAARGLAAAQNNARDAGMPIGLITDLAVGADNGGSQAWSRQQEIINGLSVGAPPDLLNPHGQSWGLGAFSPHAMRAKGFHGYIEMLRAAFAHAGGVRIDHVLGLSRLWLVADGSLSEDGAYLRYPITDLLRLIALESWRHRAIVIGEDLGTVPAEFDAVMEQAGILGIRVLLFQHDGVKFFKPADWPHHAIATSATHDLPTIAGWWQERDIDWRAQLDLLGPDNSEQAERQQRAQQRAALWHALQAAGCSAGAMPENASAELALDAAIQFIAATPAPLAMLPIEDALGLVEQPNLPGTIDAHPNWRRRLPLPVDTLLGGSAVKQRLAILNRQRACPKDTS